MFKKSIIIMIIQVIGLLLGFVNLYIIAGDMDPTVYAIIGIYQVICNMSVTFSGWGIESILCRETLYWQRNGETEKVQEYTTQALYSRVLSCVPIVPVMWIYLAYINMTRYDGKYTLLFLALFIGAVMNLFIDSFRNIVRSDGGYVFVQAMSTVNATVLKMLGLVIYVAWGALPYLYFYVLSSAPILVVFVIRSRKYIAFRFVVFKDMLKKLWEARYLWLKSDFEYVRSNVDSLLVSVLFPASVMGVYTIYKSLEQIMRGFVEGFFDVLSQNTVQYKGNAEELEIQEKKIKFARNLSIAAIMIGIVIYLPQMDFWITVVHLSKYEGVKWFVLAIAIEGIIYLYGKYEINAISFLATTKMTFFMSVVNSVVAILLYTFIIMQPNITGVLLQQMVGYVVASVLAIILFKKNKKNIYGKLNK